MNWIPTSERLPEEGVDVIVYTTSYPFAVTACYFDDKWYRDNHTQAYIQAGKQVDVTHWMYMPEPPK